MRYLPYYQGTPGRSPTTHRRFKSRVRLSRPPIRGRCKKELSMQQSSEHKARPRIGRALGINPRDDGTRRSGGLPMKSLSVAVSTVAMLACLASSPVASQQRGVEPGLQLHAVNPSLSLSAPTNSPLQDQMREDYATSLRGAQRELLRQNPSGLTPEGLAIGRELNGYMGPR